MNRVIEFLFGFVPINVVDMQLSIVEQQSISHRLDLYCSKFLIVTRTLISALSCRPSHSLVNRDSRLCYAKIKGTKGGLILESFLHCFKSPKKKRLPNHYSEHLLLRQILLRTVIYHFFLEIGAQVENVLRLGHLDKNCKLVTI